MEGLSGSSAAPPVLGFHAAGLAKAVAGETHLHPLELRLAPGSVTAVLGPTQAGKTTLLRLLAGLDQPSAGRLLRDGQDITAQKLQRRRVAMVYQEFINYPNLSVAGNIASPLRTRGVPRAAREARVRELAELVRIAPLLDRRPHQLSGGQQQRLAIARALAADAGLLLLDEPLVNLDLKLREELLDELGSIFAARDATVVYATSDSREALALGGAVAVLHEGRLHQHAPTRLAYHCPADTVAARILSDPPLSIWPARCAQGVLAIGAELRLPMTGHLAGLPPGPCQVGVRSQHLRLRQRQRDWLRLACTVELAEITGSDSFIHARAGDLELVVQEAGAHHHAAGSGLECFLDPGKVLVFDTGGRLLRSYLETHA